jgi:hypothetical protein
MHSSKNKLRKKKERKKFQLLVPNRTSPGHHSMLAGVFKKINFFCVLDHFNALILK